MVLSQTSLMVQREGCLAEAPTAAKADVESLPAKQPFVM
jgi:hypothetical protein